MRTINPTATLAWMSPGNPDPRWVVRVGVGLEGESLEVEESGQRTPVW